LDGRRWTLADGVPLGHADPAGELVTSSAAVHVLVREMRPDDAREFLEVHHAAVRGIAARDYRSTVIEPWAPLPLTDEAVEWVRSIPDGEYCEIVSDRRWIKR
jgi:hypothetical protein